MSAKAAGRKRRRGTKVGDRRSERLRSAKGRSASSARWLTRQLNDPYVREAKRLGFRSRAAFKLIELDDRFHLLVPGARVVDLGAAPGGWTQVAVARCRAGTRGGGRVVAVDREPFEPVAGATCLRNDIADDGLAERIRAALGGSADVVLSDMAPAATGHRATDHVRILALAEAALALALTLLAPDGALVAKVWQGGSEGELAAEMKRRFHAVRHAKPPASRAESAEVYVVATGFRRPA